MFWARVVRNDMLTGDQLRESEKILYDVFIERLSISLTFLGLPVVSFRAYTFASTIFDRLNETEPDFLPVEGVPYMLPS